MFREAVKDNTFLAHYLDYMSPLETPLAYDFWGGLWVLSSLVGRRMYVDRPRAPVYLNIYAILCADAGTTRKSSAVRAAGDVHRAAGLDKRSLVVTGSATPESLSNELALRSQHNDNAWCNIMVSELVTFLGREQYTMGLPGLLTDLYDAPKFRNGMRMGVEHNMRNVYVTFLSASTPSWLVRAINPDVVEGGFTSRCLFIIEEKRKRIVAWPEEIDNSDAVTTCAASLALIDKDIERFSSHNIGLSDKARDGFVKWYENRKAEATDAYTISFEAREDHHILRLAGLLACNDRSFVIDAGHMAHAIRIIAFHKAGAMALFGHGKQELKLTRGIDKLRLALANAGGTGIQQTELVFKLRSLLSTREMDYALTIMHELDMVQQFTVRTKGRPKTIWRGTNRLMLRELNKIVLDRMKHD